MLGDSLLVAPVFSADGRTRFYVPAGTWTNLLDGSQVTGPQWVTQTHGFESLPLLVRPGTVLPIGGQDDRPDYDYADGVTLQLFGVEELTSTTVQIPALGGGPGSTFEISRDGDVITVRRTAGADLPWSVRVPASTEVADFSGGLRIDDQHSDSEPSGPAGSGFGVRAAGDTVSISLAHHPTSLEESRP
jgi:alpha-D-xyloside xylohydrolase